MYLQSAFRDTNIDVYNDNVQKIAFVIALSLIAVSCIIIIIAIMNKIQTPATPPTIKCNVVEPEKIQYTKIFKQYKITKIGNDEVNIDEETNIESNVKDGSFNEIVDLVVEKSSIKNLQ